MKVSRVFLILLMAISAAGAGAWFASGYGTGSAGSQRDTSAELEKIQAQLTNSLILPENFKSVPDFSLLDKNGVGVGKELLAGKWSLLFFGFTHCPDICPMTLGVIDKALETIKTESSELPVAQVVFVSVDPKRDKPEQLKNYVEFFHPDFAALTGELNNMYELTKPLNIVVAFTADSENPESYTVDHTASILLIDPELQLRGKFNGPHELDTLVKDYQVLLKNIL